jgi:hypothetical protein
MPTPWKPQHRGSVDAIVSSWMRWKPATLRFVFILAVMLLAGLPAAPARAKTHTFLDTTDLFPTMGAGTYGPANDYPSTIVVSGIAGKVTRVRVTIIGYGSASPDDTDIAITGPNGRSVMVMSDACGLYPESVQNDNWTFDDSAPTFISNNGPCGNYQEGSFKPTNYLGEAPEPDDLSPGGGPAPPYLNALSFLAGGSPNGAWRLWVADDNSGGYLGFDIAAWALTLDVGPTGRRAAALRKCKHKGTKRARRRCRRHARSLPR